ncbi:hypothetical protein KKF59_00230 [Patescibacteria group bacterium]|nr:hypothetical protein [Patescibacteria group bacterium]MBU1034227.1 hypothetical protein [Patescibacteria group bacterium]MBU1629529.1 hypothetical protein [Patescibacteria group bacterium]MBU1907545.1 hypothetical protein [Patescibacteria group bacterium]
MNFAIIIAFLPFVLVGFWLPVIAVRFFLKRAPQLGLENHVLVKLIKANPKRTIYIFWIIYLAGLLLALPEAITGGFFNP